MMRTVRASTISTNAATMSNTINATTTDLLLVDERRRAPDFSHLDPRSRLEHLPVHERQRAPLLAADPYTTAVGVHALEHRRLRPHEGGGNKDNQLNSRTEPDCRDNCGGERRDRDRPKKKQAGGEPLPDREQHRH